MPQNVQNPISVLAKFHKCPTSAETTPESQWCHNRVYDVIIGICDDTPFSFKRPHAIDVVNDYSACTNSEDVENEWWGVRIGELCPAHHNAGNKIHFLYILA